MSGMFLGNHVTPQTWGRDPGIYEQKHRLVLRDHDFQILKKGATGGSRPPLPHHGPTTIGPKIGRLGTKSAKRATPPPKSQPEPVHAGWICSSES